MKYYKVKSWSLFLVVSCSFTLFSGLFLKNVYELQFTNSEYFQEQALSYRIKSETLKAKRGSIYDKNLNPIATSTQAFNIGIFPDKISDIKETSILLSSLLQKDSNEIAEKIINSSRFFYLDRSSFFINSLKLLILFFTNYFRLRVTAIFPKLSFVKCSYI